MVPTFARDALSAKPRPQFVLEDLAHHIARQLIDESDVFGNLVAGQILPAAIDYHIVAELRFGRTNDEGRADFAFHWLRYANDGALRDSIERFEQPLDLSRIHVEAVDDVHV